MPDAPAPKPASAANPAAAPAAPASVASPPRSRELRPPPFLLRTPDGLGSYFERENQRVVMSPHEPLSAFLAPATLVDDKTPQPGHARQRIDYDFSGCDAATFAPMDAVPASVRAAFEAAVADFYARVDDPDSRTTDHEKRLRRGFRLPDPDKEKDAYWLHGPRDDRRLLILWGCEATRGTALPLCARPDAGNTPGVLEKLRNRGMPWAALQREAVALVVEKRRPLSRFLATATRDRAGGISGVIAQGKAIPKEKLKPLKHLGTGEIRAFEREVGEFYAGARTAAEGVTPYEKELRRALRLPDPEKRPGQYFTYGGRMLVVLQGDETPDSVLCPGADTEIPMPPEEQGPDGAKFVPETVLDKLRRRATPVKQRVILAGVAAVLVLGALVAFEVFGDRTPPRVVQAVAENDPTLVRVFFDEKIDARSLAGTTAAPEPVRVRGPGGRYIAVSEVKLDPADPRVVSLKVEPLGQGDYEVVVKGVRDASRRHNAIAAELGRQFAFTDTLPPVLEKISAHAEDPARLVLVFNEPLDARSLRDRNNYSIPGFNLRGAEAGADPLQVVLTVDKPFENHGRYSLRVEGLADRAQNIPAAAIERDFEYADTIAPTLESVEAVASQVRVQAQFSKKLGAGAADPGLYSVESKGEGDTWEPVTVRVARLPDETRPVVELITAPLRNGVVYRLFARGVPDRAEPPNLLAEAPPKEFRFTGREDKTPPGLGRPRLRDGTNNREIEVTFNEDVTSETALRAEAFSFVENPTPITDVTTADGAMVRTVVLHLANPLPQGSRLTVRATGIADFVGNTNEEAVSEQFWVSGMGVPEDTSLRLVSARPGAGGTQVTLEFNEGLTAATATQAANYGIPGGRRVARVIWAAAKPAEVTLVLDGSTPLTRGNYAVTARNLMLAELPDFLQHAVTASVVVP